jgi:hypothetical protein
MFFHPRFIPGLAIASYMVGDEKTKQVAASASTASSASWKTALTRGRTRASKSRNVARSRSTRSPNS